MVRRFLLPSTIVPANGVPTSYSQFSKQACHQRLGYLEAGSHIIGYQVSGCRQLGRIMIDRGHSRRQRAEQKAAGRHPPGNCSKMISHDVLKCLDRVV